MKRVAARTSLVGLALAVALGLFLTGCRPEDIGGTPPPVYPPTVRGLWFGRIQNAVRDETQYIALELEQYSIPNTAYLSLSGRVTYYIFVVKDTIPVFYTSVSGYLYPDSKTVYLYWEDLGRRFQWSCALFEIEEQQLSCSHPGFLMNLARSKKTGWGGTESS